MLSLLAFSQCSSKYSVEAQTIDKGKWKGRAQSTAAFLEQSVL